MIGDSIAELLAHAGEPVGALAGAESFGGIFGGLAAVAPFGIVDGTRDCFGGDFDVLRGLACAGEKAANFKRGVMTCL